jgi:hypothetical protein
MISIVAAILLCSSVAQAGMFQTEIVSMDLSGDGGGAVTIIRQSQLLPSPGQITLTYLGGEQFQVDSFFDVFTELSIDSGQTWQTGPAGNMVTSLLYETNAYTETVEIELVSMDLVGDIGGIPVLIRTNPDLPSPGTTIARDLGNGTFAVDSFFDVFTEISVDGGPFETGPTGVMQTENTFPSNDFKWLQLPDMEWGYDIWSWGFENPDGTVMIVNEVADDWRCPDGRPITDVHWWGSFKGWMEDVPPDFANMPLPDAADMPLYYILSMHLDNPPGIVQEWSLPATLINQVQILPGDVSIVYFDSNPVLDHATGQPVFPELWEHEYEFFVDLEAMGLMWEQIEGEIYWLDIVAIYPEPTGEPVEQSKWKQEPDMDYGYDIWSWGYDDSAGGPQIIVNEVADDWLCADGQDITRIRWWGSFREWLITDDAPVQPPSLAELPLYFILSMHKDVPANSPPKDYPYSSPMDPPIQTTIVPMSSVLISYFDVNPMIDHATGELMPQLWEHEYEFEVALEEPWPQTEGEIYWLDIVAIYPQDPEPHHVFGWKTADPRKPAPDPDLGWIDDAVSSINDWDNYLLNPPVPYPPTNWYELVYGPMDGIAINPNNGLYYAGGWNGYWPSADSMDTSVNMSFELFTESVQGEPNHVFGWKTADPHQPVTEWIDDAVSTVNPWTDATVAGAIPYPPSPLDWKEMVYGPIDGTINPLNGLFYAGGWDGYWEQSVGMAFGLTTLPPEEPADPQKWVQWPDTVYGYDIWSWGIVDPDYPLGDLNRYLIGNEVAEDWRCLDGRAITNITWWGSFENYIERQVPSEDIPVPGPDMLPAAFLLSMHADDRVTYQYSSPLNPPILTVEIPVDKVAIKYFDSNPRINHESGDTISGEWEHEFEFYVELDEPWIQDQGTVYWLDIVALYREEQLIEPKWLQTPDMTSLNGIDIRAEEPVPGRGQVVADDWRCNDPRPIVAVRWWGSYLNAIYEPPAGSTGIIRTLPFVISLHNDNATAPEPGPLAIPLQTVQANESYLGLDATGKAVYEYFAVLPQEFVQTEGQIYWIDIEIDLVSLNWDENTWGWHNTSQPWNNRAVTSTTSHTGPWNIIPQDMSFELLVPTEVGFFGWKTADPNQPAPDPTPGTGEDGWIDDAVSSSHPASPITLTPYPPSTWLEMRYGSTTTGVYFGGVSGYHYIPGQINPSVAMSFIIDSTPRLDIEPDPTGLGGAVLVPTIDPTIPFEIWYNYNMVDLDDATWNLLGAYPAGTTSIPDPGVLTPGAPPVRKFYILKE